MREGKILDDKSLLDLTCKLTMQIVTDLLKGSSLVGPECSRVTQMLFAVANDRGLDLEAAKQSCEEQWNSANPPNKPQP